MSIPLVSRVQAWPARTWLLGLAAVIAGLALVLAGRFARPYTFHGSLIESPAPAPDFTLNAQHGQPFRLSDQAGKVVLLYFGYTFCPDVCPTSLSTIAQALSMLTPTELKRVASFMISVDPERDTPARLAKYMAAFNPRFLGLHGTQAEIAPIIKAYGVTMARRELPNSALKYTIDHSPFIYVIDKAGSWRELLQDGVPIADMANDIRYFIHNGG